MATRFSKRRPQFGLSAARSRNLPDPQAARRRNSHIPSRRFPRPSHATRSSTCPPAEAPPRHGSGHLPQAQQPSFARYTAHFDSPPVPGVVPARCRGCSCVETYDARVVNASVCAKTCITNQSDRMTGDLVREGLPPTAISAKKTSWTQSPRLQPGAHSRSRISSRRHRNTKEVTKRDKMGISDNMTCSRKSKTFNSLIKNRKGWDSNPR